MSQDFNENVIEFIEHEKTAYVTFSEEKFINRIKKVAERNPECKILEKTKSHIYASIPVEWIQIRPKARFSDEQRKAMIGNLRKPPVSGAQNEAKTDSSVKEV